MKKYFILATITLSLMFCSHSAFANNGKECDKGNSEKCRPEPTPNPNPGGGNGGGNNGNGGGSNYNTNTNGNTANGGSSTVTSNPVLISNPNTNATASTGPISNNSSANNTAIVGVGVNTTMNGGPVTNTNSVTGGTTTNTLNGAPVTNTLNAAPVTATTGNSTSTSGSTATNTGNNSQYSSTTSYNEVRQVPMAYVTHSDTTADCTNGNSVGGATGTFSVSGAFGRGNGPCNWRADSTQFHNFGYDDIAATNMCYAKSIKKGMGTKACLEKVDKHLQQQQQAQQQTALPQQQIMSVPVLPNTPAMNPQQNQTPTQTTERLTTIKYVPNAQPVSQTVIAQPELIRPQTSVLATCDFSKHKDAVCIDQLETAVIPRLHSSHGTILLEVGSGIDGYARANRVLKALTAKGVQETLIAISATPNHSGSEVSIILVPTY